MPIQIKNSDARLLISCLLNGDTQNVSKMVSNYVESAYSSYSNEKTKSLLECISDMSNRGSI